MTYSAPETAAVLAAGATYRKSRLAMDDMLTTEKAAELAGVSRTTICEWLKKGKCFGVQHMRRGYKLPRWQFEPYMHELIPELLQALGTQNGWTVLAFLENPAEGLGMPPHAALATGAASKQRIIELAIAASH